jgi:hypothetical protein
MDTQPTEHRRTTEAAARTIAVGVAVAALVVTLGAGQALATTAPPDERVLERQGRVDNHEAAGQADEQAKAEEPVQGSPAQTSRRYFKPEPPVAYGPPLDSNEPLFPASAPPPPASDRTGLVIGLAVAALLLAAGAATTWRIQHRRPRPEPTPERPASPPGPLSRTGSPSHPATPSDPRHL